MEEFFRTHPLLLAPMAGVSDQAFRMLCRKQGANITYTEMVSAKGLAYENNKTRELLRLAPGERQVAVQLFGHEPHTMAAQGAWVEQELGSKLAFLDINMGCPAKKIVTKGDGSALMKNPDLAARIVAELVRAVEHPVTVKFRRGWTLGDETAVTFAHRMEQAGAAALALHGRYAQQLYRGKASWESIARVKNSVGIPVIGNGDVRCGADAYRMREVCGCDAVMIGRAAQGNPWIFAQAYAALNEEKPPALPTFAERLALARQHARLLAAREKNGMLRMRKHAMWYVAGFPAACEIRRNISLCTTLKDFEDLFDQIAEQLQSHDIYEER